MSDIKGIQPAFRAGKVKLTEHTAATIPAGRLLAVTSTFCGAISNASNLLSSTRSRPQGSKTATQRRSEMTNEQYWTAI
jgi:hypothetical protein